MISSIAWKNIWRNKLRSSVVIAAITFGLFAGIVSVAFMNGLINQRVDKVINTEVAAFQLHNSKYQDNNEVKYVIDNVDEKLDFIKSQENVTATAKRFKVEAMLSVAASANGAILNGILPESEKKISDVYKYLLDSNSTYLTGMKRNPILISEGLAEKMNIGIRSKIVISGQSTEGDIVRESFRVCGLYNTGNSMFDDMNVYVRYSDLARAFKLDTNSAHEIAIMTEDVFEIDSLYSNLRSEFTKYKIDENAIIRAQNDSLPNEMLAKFKQLKSDKYYDYQQYTKMLSDEFGEDIFEEYQKNLLNYAEAGVIVRSWKQISPEVQLLTDWMDLMLLIFVGTILFALGFGIINTMLMVVLERVKELGMLMAIGMNRTKVFLMIMYETVLLSLSGGILGMALSALLLLIVGDRGVDLSFIQEGMEAMGYSTYVYLQISAFDFLQVTIMVVLIGVLSSIYPAIKAIKLKPADAIRSEM
jgi:ABC-type lipoprotein release transport system permease subunit